MKLGHLAMAAWVLCSVVHGGEVRWKDPATGAHYMLIPGERDFRESDRACRSRGWDLFNFEYLSEEERLAFLASPIVEALHWDRRFVGEPGEREEAQVWMSSEWGAIACCPMGRSVSTLRITRHPGEPATPVTSWNAPESARQTVCMYRSHTWFGCSHEVRCTTESASGPSSLRFSIMEYGATKAEVMSRLRERAITTKMVGFSCDLGLRDPICLSYR